ncbi:MAG: type II CRISPR RNA-guided endonuclease Cas9 [Planctomycetota bacterium]
METKGDLKFKAIAKLIGLPKGCAFNLERGDEEKLIGNRTNAKFSSVFDSRWYQFSPAEREAAIADVISIQKRETLKKRGVEHWKLSDEQAEKLAGLSLEEGHTSLSRKAIENVLPLLEQGMPFATARKEKYPESDKAGQVYSKLPQVMQELPDLRNPMVARTLTELRKVVNAIVRQYGRPDCIRVELARDLKRPRKQREEITKKNRENQKARATAITKLLNEAGIQNPKGNDIEKALLWEECKGICPYTARSINFKALFGSESQFDIEHIIPFSRSLDNSFLNKTLCYHEENRNVKRNRTPFEAYGGNSDRWEQIINCVKRFQGNAVREKLRRFRLTEDEAKEMFENFSSRQLNDTRYASRLAIEYLGLLYGGAIDKDGTRRVQVGGGQITAFLRNEWKLNPILSDGPGKSRDDHRHHAVDAVVIALTDNRTVHLLSQAAERATLERRHRFGQLAPPWPSFCDDVKATIGNLVVSHRVNRKVSGALHEETLYSPPRDEHGAKADKGVYVHVRKRIEALSKSELENIVDPCIKKIIMAKLGGGDPKKVFADTTNHPVLQTKDGRVIPIHKARIRKKQQTFALGQEPSRRHVVNESNHHIEIVEVKNKRGQLKWEGTVVPMFEASRRLKLGQPVVKRDHGDDKRFVFALSGRDAIEVTVNGSVQRLIVRSVNQQMAFARMNDARMKKDILNAKEWITYCIEPLRKISCRKVVISPLGEVLPAND